MKQTRSNKKKYFPLAAGMILLPAYSFAGSGSSTFDMETYSAFAGYGFFAILVIFFSFVLYYTSADHQEPLKAAVPIRVIVTARNLSSAALKGLNAAYYSVFALILLYLAIFVTLMF